MNPAARLVDGLLEVSVVGSFSKFGYQTRSRLGRWPPPHRLPGASVLVTGATSGLGYQASIDFARLGASVTFVGRDPDRARRARDSIAESSAGGDVSFLVADMSDLQSVRDAAAAYLEQHETLDVLVHNAGALNRTYETTPEGNEVTVATHVLGPFLLTGLLLPTLRRGRTDPTRPGRVLTVSSGGMYSQRFDLERLSGGSDEYDGVATYARAKRAQVVLNHEWANRIPDGGVVFHAMHPGWADTPGVRESLPGFFRLTEPILRSPEQGVDTLVWLAQAPEAAGSSGRFWLDRRRRGEYKLPWTKPADPSGDQARLWRWCAERTGWDDVAPA